MNSSNIGIWIDSERALIVRENKGDTALSTIESQIEHFNPSGGYGTDVAYQKQDSTSESKLLNRKKQQFQKYFDKIIQDVKSADKIIICGPAETKLMLQKSIEDDSEIANKLISVVTKDSLTENQLKAYVRDFFSTI